MALLLAIRLGLLPRAIINKKPFITIGPFSIADIFTKSLCSSRFHYLKDKLMLKLHSQLKLQEKPLQTTQLTHMQDIKGSYNKYGYESRVS
ncbi:hypothetical protein CsSME_00008459 [Camellia sinensis var. sinensis]